MDYDVFHGVSDISDASYSETLSENVAMYVDWALLNINAFYDVRINQYTYGTDLSKMRPVSQSGRIWESNRPGWVWESGTYGRQPIRISGVFVNGTLTSGYQLNYRDGQVIFNNNLSAQNVVKVEYSNKMYQVYQTKDNPWFKQMLSDEFISYGDNYMQIGSGVYDIFKKNRVQTPFVAVEIVPKIELRPYQMGGGQWKTQDVLMWVASDKESQTQNMIEYLANQKDKTLLLFNLNDVRRANRQPYRYDGTLNPSGLNFKQLVDSYYYKNARIMKTSAEGWTNGPPLYIGVVRWSLEAVFGEL